jgi:hypothetical protein
MSESEDDWRGIGINFWLLALSGFLALSGSLWLFIAPFWLFMAFTALYGSLWLLQLEEAKNRIPRKPARLDPPARREYSHQVC